MGIVNITPDSFSDGGKHLAPIDAVAWAKKLISEGADILDIGAESTRPGAEPVSAQQERERLENILPEVVRFGVPVSIDTRKPEIAAWALQHGVKMVNDVGGLSLPEMVSVCKDSECSICIMHMQGHPQSMQKNPQYGDVVNEVRSFLIGQAEMAEKAGINKNRLWIDPGIGFGKDLEHNLHLLKSLNAFAESGYPTLLGVSNKRFIGSLVGTVEKPANIDDRAEGNIAVQTLAQQMGVKMLRVHDVKGTVRAVKVVSAILGGE